MELSDKDVILRIKEGQIDFFSVLVKKYTNKIHGYVKSKLFDKENTDDIVQNSFLQFYKAINRFDGERPILPYLYQIAKNELKMYYRSHKETVSLNELTAANISDDVNKNDNESDTWELVNTLPDTEKKALRWLYEGYTYKELSKRLQKPVNTVKTLVRRARIQLKKLKKNE